MRNKPSVPVGGSLDANILLRWLLGDIPEQQKSVDRLLSKGACFHVSDLAIIEVAFILEKLLGFDRELISDNLFQIIDHRQMRSNQGLFSVAVPHYVGHPKLSLVDCCLAAYAELQNAIPLWTFDKKLGAQHSSAKVLG
jgi:predicted nucleic-acid-binding protein